MWQKYVLNNVEDVWEFKQGAFYGGSEMYCCHLGPFAFIFSPAGSVQEFVQ